MFAAGNLRSDFVTAGPCYAEAGKSGVSGSTSREVLFTERQRATTVCETRRRADRPAVWKVNATAAMTVANIRRHLLGPGKGCRARSDDGSRLNDFEQWVSGVRSTTGISVGELVPGPLTGRGRTVELRNTSEMFLYTSISAGNKSAPVAGTGVACLVHCAQRGGRMARSNRQGGYPMSLKTFRDAPVEGWWCGLGGAHGAAGGRPGARLPWPSGQRERVPWTTTSLTPQQAFVHPGGQVIPWLDQPPPEPGSRRSPATC